MSSTMTKTAFPNTLEPILAEMFVNEFDKHPSLISDIYDVRKSSKSKETYLEMATLDNFQPWAGALNTDGKNEEGTVEITNVTWTNSFDITLELYEDKKYNIMEGKSRGMAISAKRTKEVYAFSLFNHAFDTTFTGVNGVQLCSASQTSTASPGTTWSNRGTTALGSDGYDAARLAMRKFTDHKDNQIFINPDLLLVSPDNEKTAMEITYSKLKSGEISNTANPINQVWRPTVLVSNFLTDTNNWFLMDSSVTKMHLHWQNRIPLKLYNDTSVDVFTMRFAGRYRCAVGFSDWRGVYGSEVAA